MRKLSAKPEKGKEMKRPVKKSKSVVEGAPSGLIISLMVHVAAFMLAGLFVVFTVHHKDEKKFVPPKPVERPKMKLKKPKVKVKKNAKPKSSERIVTKVQRANMPDIQLPEMSGIGDGIGTGGGGGGFDLLPDLEEISVLGSARSIGSDLEGTFYDFNHRRNGDTYGMDTDVFITELAAFVKSGCNPRKLARYYRSPRKLYTSTIAVPPMPSPLAPRRSANRITWIFAGDTGAEFGGGASGVVDSPIPDRLIYSLPPVGGSVF